MKFRSGKYAGQDVAHVQQIAPWYINWVRINRPEMLSEKPSYNPAKKKVEQTYKPSAIKPNYDFDNEAEQHPGKVIKPLPKLSWDEAF
jgi:hypothetical protein